MRCLLTITRMLFSVLRVCFDHTIQCGIVRLRAPLLVCLVWFVALYRDGPGFVLIGMLASIWHELGHILCYLVLFGRLPLLTISVAGIGMRVEWERESLLRIVALAAAGPAANFAAAAICSLFLAKRMTVTGIAIWCANVLVGGFNLLPVPPLDGFRILCCAREFWVNKLHFRGK